MPFPVVVDRNSGQDADSFSITVPVPGTAQVGDLFVIAVSCRFNGAFTWPSGWTALVSDNGDTANLKREVRKKALSSGDISGGSIVVSKNFHGDQGWASYLFRGSLPAEGSGSWSIGTVDPPSLSPSWGSAETLWIALSVARGGAVTAYPSGYSHGINPGTGEAFLGCAELALAAATENPGAFSWNTSNDISAATIAIKGVPPIPKSWVQVIG